MCASVEGSSYVPFISLSDIPCSQHSKSRLSNDPYRTVQSRNVGYSLFQDQNHLRGHLVDLMEVDDPGTGRGQLQHSDLVDDLIPAVFALSPLPHEFGGKLVA